jgi:chaperonin GroES
MYDRILVERIAAEEQFGGVYVPEVAKEQPLEGVVLKVGDGRLQAGSAELLPLKVRVGDHILFGRFSGSPVVVDKKDYLVMREDEVLAILVEKEEA